MLMGKKGLCPIFYRRDVHEKKDGLRSDFLESKKKERKTGNVEEIARRVGLATSLDRWEGRKRTNERTTDLRTPSSGVEIHKLCL